MTDQRRFRPKDAESLPEVESLSEERGSSPELDANLNELVAGQGFSFELRAFDQIVSSFFQTGRRSAEPWSPLRGRDRRSAQPEGERRQALSREGIVATEQQPTAARLVTEKGNLGLAFTSDQRPLPGRLYHRHRCRRQYR